MSSTEFLTAAVPVTCVAASSPQLSTPPKATTEVAHDVSETATSLESSYKPEAAISASTTVMSTPSKKRKRQSSISNSGPNDKAIEVVTKKKQKVNPTKDDNGDKPPARPAPLHTTVHSRMNKNVQAMRKTKSVPRSAPISSKQAHEPSRLQGLKRVEHIAPSMLLSVGKNRDCNGKMSIFEYRQMNAPLEPHLISDVMAQTWRDEQDANITWMVLPTSKKWITMYGKTIAVSRILEEKHNYPQFTLVETIKGPHKKTGKTVTKAHKFKCEKMDEAQIAERIKMDLAREKNATKQAKKDATAASRRTRDGRVSKKTGTRTSRAMSS
ncbi:hypothetical protein J1614_007826 [Plenodomus biglobosus]|nr:hypothetical protein J1614_007826 [Plenodomus biglobosus]